MRNGKIRRDRGIALVSVMGAIAVITAIVVALSYRQQIDIGIQGYAIQKNGAILNVLSVENLASAILTNTKGESNRPEYDYYDEPWSEPVVDLELGGAKTSFIILDAQSRFNVNNLNINGRNRGHSIEILRNVFSKLELNDGKIYQEASGWLRPNYNLRARDRIYMQESDLFRKHRAPDSPMISAAEMRLMQSLREKEDLADIIESFADYVVFLPTVNELVKININTASDEILYEALKYFKAEESLLSITRAKPHSNVNAICSFLREKRELCGTFFDVKSSYFYVFARINMGSNRVYSQSLLKVEGGKTITVKRELRFI